MSLDDFIYMLFKEPYIDHIEGWWVIVYATLCTIVMGMVGLGICYRLEIRNKTARTVVSVIFMAFTVFVWYKIYPVIVV